MATLTKDPTPPVVSVIRRGAIGVPKVLFGKQRWVTNIRFSAISRISKEHEITFTGKILDSLNIPVNSKLMSLQEIGLKSKMSNDIDIDTSSRLSKDIEADINGKISEDVSLGMYSSVDRRPLIKKIITPIVLSSLFENMDSEW